jgi:putative PIN family toxin of toxin-antitoxin system
MSNEIRVVVDTNVIVSAMLFNSSAPGQALALLLERGSLLVSIDLVEELNEVLSREKFARYVTREEREQFLEALIAESELVEIKESIAICRDPKDDHLLELAASSGATVIVTGDRDLLVLDPFRNIRIVTPHDFLQQFGGTSPPA